MVPNRSALLFELRGENSGAVHVISQDPFRIGSDEENDLVLKEPNIALYQAEIQSFQGQFLIKNLSLEGTAFLNGEPFEEAGFQRGDILTLGEAVFRFVESGETLTQQELWQAVGGKQEDLAPALSTFRRVPFLVGLTVFAVCVVLFIMVNQRGRDEKGDQGDQGKIKVFETRVSLKDMKSLYDRGVDLINARRWDEAILVFGKIRKNVPNYRETHNHYRKAVRESEYLEALNQGKGLWGEKDLVRSKASLEMILEESVYYREALRMIREINNGIVEIKLLEAEKKLEQQDWAEAKSIATSVLFIYPDNVRARQILSEANLKQRTFQGKRYDRQEKLEEAMRISSKTSPKRPWVPPPAKGTGAWYLAKATGSYTRGDMNGSLRYLETFREKAPETGGRALQRAKEMEEDLLHAKTFYTQADTLQQQERFSEAVELWENFLERDRRISGGGSGVYFQKASSSLSDIYYRRGKEEFDRENLRGAFHFWNMARQVHTKNGKVNQGLGQLAQSAKEIYREGYILEGINPNRALLKWEEVLEIVPPGDPYYKKARSRVDWKKKEHVVFGDDEDLNERKHKARSPREIYREGYILEEINPTGALERWKTIVGGVPKDHPYYKKANKKILENEG